MNKNKFNRAKFIQELEKIDGYDDKSVLISNKLDQITNSYSELPYPFKCDQEIVHFHFYTYPADYFSIIVKDLKYFIYFLKSLKCKYIYFKERGLKFYIEYKDSLFGRLKKFSTNNYYEYSHDKRIYG